MEFKLPCEVEFVLNSLRKKGFDSYIVGGCVRDRILGIEPADYDIATSAKPEDIIENFDHTVPTGIEHGTVTVIVDKKHIEVTTFRIDGEYSDSRHPDEVRFTDNIREDLSRRDFTINAIAYNPDAGIFDPFNGNKDIQSKLVKAVGNPDKRFTEDALRMLRAVRFACKLQFDIEDSTFKSIQKNNENIHSISRERVRDEFIKIITCDNPVLGIKLLLNTGLLKDIVPELYATMGFDQRSPYHDKDVFKHTLSVLENTKNDPVLRLAALMHDIGKPDCFSIGKNGVGHFYNHNVKSTKIAQRIMQRLRFDNNTISTVCTLIKEHMSDYADYTPYSLKKFMIRVGRENMGLLFDLMIADAMGHKPPYGEQRIRKIDELRKRVDFVLKNNDPLSLKDLNINGYDLIDIGITKGENIGFVLNKLLDLVLKDPKLNNKEYLLNMAKKLMAQNC